MRCRVGTTWSSRAIVILTGLERAWFHDNLLVVVTHIFSRSIRVRILLMDTNERTLIARIRCIRRAGKYDCNACVTIVEIKKAKRKSLKTRKVSSERPYGFIWGNRKRCFTSETVQIFFEFLVSKTRFFRLTRFPNP